MGFFKKLFGKERPKEEPFVPTPTQHIPGVEPIIVQAIENLFPNTKDQKDFFEGLQKKSQNADTVLILALLSMTKVADVEASKKFVLGTISQPVIDPNIYYFVSHDCIFHNMKGAEKWVKSITKPQA
jgi:hypothetical protein